MLSLICSAAAAFLTFFVLRMTPFGVQHPYWSVFFGAMVFLLIQLAVMLILKHLSGKISVVLQGIMQDTQKQINLKQQQFMRHPMAQKQMLAELEHLQNAGLSRMIAALDLYKPLSRWNLMLAKQVNTMRMCYLYMQKKFDQVDALLPKCLFIDAESSCMNMARMYVNKVEDKVLDKFYRKKARALKDEGLALMVCTYAWILVKRERYDDAAKALNDAKLRSKDNPVVIKNWEMLVNGKPKHFSNTQLGDQWFALQLETPKMPKMQQTMRYR